MTTRHLVDPDLAPLLDQFPARQFTRQALPQLRAQSSDLAAHLSAALPAFSDIEITERFVPGPARAPDVRVLVYMPKSASRPLPGLLWMHGGGYVMGSPEGEDANLKETVQQVGCAAISVDYRLAPETAFPGAIEDCYAALKWLYSHAPELAVDASRLAIGGRSAGGGLAAALGLLTRDRGEVPLAFQLLIFPMLDDRTAMMTDPNPYTGEFLWSAEANHFGWSALLGHEPGREGVSPYAAAARAESLAGLPPAYLSVGTLDLFLDEDLEYARRLMRAGVPTELHVYPGAYHGYPWVPHAWMSQAEARNSQAALRRALRPVSPAADTMNAEMRATATGGPPAE